MHQSIEQEIIRGEAIATFTTNGDVILEAFRQGLKVYAPQGEWVGRKLDWHDKAAKVANRLKIAELREALAK